MDTEARKQYRRKWMADRRDKTRGDWSRDNVLSPIQARARRLKIPFSIAMDDIPLPLRCPILGIPLKRGEGVCSPNSPSVDRIIPALGYIPGNVAVISMRANAMKNMYSLQELRALIAWLESNYPGYLV